MTVYQFRFYEFQDFTFTGGAGSTSQTVSSTGTFTLINAPTSVPVVVTVDDDDLDFNDGFLDPVTLPAPLPSSTGNNNQILQAPLTINGTTYPTGTKIELEYAVSTSSTEGTQLIFYYVRVDGQNVGIVGLQDPAPGVTYTITGSRDGNLTPTGDFPATSPTQLPWLSLPCFTHGTLIDTPSGPRLIEELEPGDLVTTFGNGSQPLRWVGTRTVSQAEMLARTDLRPVQFEVGTLANTRPLLVSPQHRMLLNDWRAEVYFGEDSVLVAAKALLNGKTIRQVIPKDGVVYCHLLFDQHEVIVAEGALSESFHPGEIGLGGLDDAQRREIDLLFPQLMLEDRRPAFPIVRVSEAKALRLPS
jgi:hypothetical protein